MALLDWIFVIFGVAIAFTGSWIQLHPERVVPGQSEVRRSSGWQLDPAALSQIRLLGACFLFMGTFFALQMTIDLAELPWWIGTLSGMFTAIASVAWIHARVRQQHGGRCQIQQSPLPAKILELR